MTTPHKHRDVIIAWANGEEIEYKHRGEWVSAEFPSWCNDSEYRIKPKRVKKEGWVNVHKNNMCAEGYTFSFHGTKNEAEGWNYKQGYPTKRVACVRIEWEEEE